MVGSTCLDFAYRREEGLHRYELVPRTAAVPPIVVFEARVPGTVREARIDGTAAELDVRRRAAEADVSVQLPVDGPRVIEIETDRND